MNFDPLREQDVHKLILDTANKSCLLDRMPTSLMFECQDILLPVITSLINLSLESGQFANVWKEAIGYPLLIAKTPLQIFVLLVIYLTSLSFPRKLFSNN